MSQDCRGVGHRLVACAAVGPDSTDTEASGRAELEWLDVEPVRGGGIRGAALLKRVFVGRPRPTHELEDTLLSKFLALPIFSSDPISSVAYATEAAMLVLVGVSLSERHLVFPLAIVIAVLLAIVALSYTQVVRAYETSGGAYVVAKDNFGTAPSLVAGAALLVDYVLTVSVSVAGGVLAITSAVPSLTSWNVKLSVIAIAIITFVNLRGVRESGIAFALPTYGFVVSMFALVAVGLYKTITGTAPHAVAPHPIPAGAGAIGVFVLLRAFASGSSALTGVEAIANGVNAFRRPQSSNAAKTLLMMASIAIVLFLGVSYLAVQMKTRPSSTVSVLSEIANGIFPSSSSAHFMFWVVQVFTFAILVLAANTSYQGFPRLAAIMARDGFMPRQFSNLGDRLVFSNGMLVLATIATALILIFSANVNSLIHLYVLGVFTAFTLSQAGMVRHWFRTRERGWRVSALINGVGAAATGLVGVIVIATKFTEGAWAVVVAIPVLVVMFLATSRHYSLVARRLRRGVKAVLAQPAHSQTVLLYVERLDPATRTALWYAQTIANGDLRAIHVPFHGSDPGIKPRFYRVARGNPHLELLASDQDPIDAVLDYVWELPHSESNFVTVVIPELFHRPTLLAAFLRRTTFSLKLRLLAEPGLVVTDVPRVHKNHVEFVDPKRAGCIVPVGGVNAASLRAVRYAETLGFPDTRALSLAFEQTDAEKIRSEWARNGITMPLEIVEPTHRDLGRPILARVRQITADPDAIAVVVMPELVVRGVDRLLHNQRALYLKRLLLFEPNVILASVPYQFL
jgi:amino acid transporter